MSAIHARDRPGSLHQISDLPERWHRDSHGHAGRWRYHLQGHRAGGWAICPFGQSAAEDSDLRESVRDAMAKGTKDDPIEIADPSEARANRTYIIKPRKVEDDGEAVQKRRSKDRGEG